MRRVPWTHRSDRQPADGAALARQALAPQERTGGLRACTAPRRPERNTKGAVISRADYVSTPNGYDQRWIDAINAVMEDRERFDVRITDITDGFWDRFVG